MLSFANVVSEELGASVLVTELMIVAAVAIAVKWVRLPYTIALVVAGLGVGLLRAQHFIDLDVSLTPELVFTIFLPVLLFEAAFHLHFHQLKENAKTISLFAVVGVLLSSLGVGYALHLGLGMPLPSALVFGALISATDPISVLALFKQLKAPPRLSILVEGESLFNDGAAVVIFQILLALALTGEFSLSAGIARFLFVSLGGLLMGIALGYIVSKITALVDDHLIEITLSTILAYGSYIGAEHLGVSGVMSVIAAGIVYGNYGKEIGMSPRTRVMMAAFWEYAGFLMNSLVFLLIGTQVDLRLLATEWQAILFAFLSVVLVRAVVVLFLAPVAGKLETPISGAWRAVIVWAGLRGSISMALAIGLPASIAGRETILLMCFGVVLISLFLQGLSMPPLLRKLGVIGQVSDEVQMYETRLGQLMMHQRAVKELEKMRADFSVSRDVYEELMSPHEEAVATLQEELVSLGRQQDSIRQEQLRDASRYLRTVQVAALRDGVERGLISTDVRDTLIDELAVEQVELMEQHEEGEPPVLRRDGA